MERAATEVRDVRQQLRAAITIERIKEAPRALSSRHHADD
jgi:hypothetical protein